MWLARLSYTEKAWGGQLRAQALTQNPVNFWTLTFLPLKSGDNDTYPSRD